MKKIIIFSIILLAVFFIFRENRSGPQVSQNGIATNQLADNLMAKYDMNADGKLNVSTESFKRSEIEKIKKVESRGLLFTDADKLGNKDGYVSKNELLNYLDTFDSNGDGEITSYKNIFNSLFNGKSEWAKFDEKYSEKFKYEEEKFNK